MFPNLLLFTILLLFTLLLFTLLLLFTSDFAIEAPRQPVQYTASLCEVYHPKRDEETWLDRRTAGIASAEMQWSARGDQNMQERVP